MISSSVDRLDAWDKVTGRAVYAADRRTDGLLLAFALRATVGRGVIKAIDVDAARAMPGIAAIVTHENAGEFGWLADSDADALSAEMLGRSALNDPATQLPMYRPLCGAEILFAGQWVALVVATTIEFARAALAAIVIDYEEWPPGETTPVLPGPFFAGDMQYVRGAPCSGSDVASSVCETYATPMQLHQPMEPSATTAVWGDGGVTLYDSTQGVHAVRNYVARSLRVQPDRVRVIAPFVGGGFGAKNQVWPHQALAAHLARHIGRPVRMQLTRADMAVASGYRTETSQEIELQANSQGQLKLLRHVSHVPTSLRGGFFEPCGLNSLMLYEAERVEVSHLVTRRSVATPTPFRAPGETPGSFALETALDELAFNLRMDPLQLRIRNHASRDAYHDRPWSSNNLLQCYTQGAERFGWPGRFIEPRSMSRDGRLIGYGMATTAYPAPALAAAVRLSTDGPRRLVLETSATDIGTGMRTILAQTVADQLLIDISTVEVRHGDSSLPEAPTAGRSKSTASVLPAVVDACRALQEELDRLAPARTAGANEGLYDRLESAGTPGLVSEGRSDGVPMDRNLSFYSFGAHFAEVEVDEGIGQIRVRRFVSAFDCGRIVNHKLATSQILGGITFGIGMALLEEANRHPSSLRVLADNLADYAIPVNADMPEIEVLFIEKPDNSLNALGARGLGEIGLPGVAAAIGNALFNATGRRHRSLPIPLSAQHAN